MKVPATRVDSHALVVSIKGVTRNILRNQPGKVLGLLPTRLGAWSVQPIWEHATLRLLACKLLYEFSKIPTGVQLPVAPRVWKIGEPVPCDTGPNDLSLEPSWMKCIQLLQTSSNWATSGHVTRLSIPVQSCISLPLIECWHTGSEPLWGSSWGMVFHR